MNYYIKCKENGDVIESCETLEEAESIISKYEAGDKADGIYEEDFYEIDMSQQLVIDIGKQLEIERIMRMYAGGACVMTAKQFALYANNFELYYGITGVEAAQKLKEANVKKMFKKWFIPDIADKIVKNML